MGPGWGPRERRPQETKSLGLLAVSVPDQWVCHGFLPSQLIETSMGKKDPWRFEGRGGDRGKHRVRRDLPRLSHLGNLHRQEGK